MLSVYSSATDLREAALAATDESLMALHYRCEERAFAAVLALALIETEPPKRRHATHWLHALHELHPDLISTRLPRLCGDDRLALPGQ